MLSWKEKNPSYEIILLTKNNISFYLPEVDFKKIKHIDDSIQRFSDMVRLFILEKYGGVWCDSSTICLKPFSKWLTNKSKYLDFIGFYVDLLTIPELKEKSPVIENWFFACPPHSKFIKDWLQEFLRISLFPTVDDYVKNVRGENVKDKILIPEYLSMHIACQKILQENVGKYKISLFRAEDTAFKYLVKNDWDSKKAIDKIKYCFLNSSDHCQSYSGYCDEIRVPIIKLRGGERNEFEKFSKKTKDLIFSFILNRKSFIS
jgi:hypothetical protein